MSARNPLREGLKLPRVPAPCALVVFGASGDLTRRKLFPAIYALAARGMLPEHFAIVGVSRSEETDAEFKARMKESVRDFGRDKLDEKVWKRLAAGMHYVAADVAGGGGEDALLDLLARLDRQRGTAGNRVFYLAVPPSAFSILIEKLGRRRGEWGGWTRLIVEKPFGTDRGSAHGLNDEVHRYFDERAGSRDARELEPLAQRVSRAHSSSTVLTACPPNWLRSAAFTLAANDSSWREAKRAKSDSVIAGAGTLSSIAFITVQRPSPESST